MPWIACDVDLPFEPKTLDLADAMGWDHFATVGRLLKFWGWCLKFAPDGDLSRLSHERIAQGMDLPAVEGHRLVDAMVRAEWLDDKPYLRVHDWWSLVGLFLRGRYQRDPERWQRVQKLYGQEGNHEARKRPAGADPDPQEISSPVGPAPGQESACFGAALEPLYPTVHNSTVHDSTEPPPPRPPRDAQKVGDGDDDGDGSRKMLEELKTLKREIFRRSGMRRISSTDEEQLAGLIHRFGGRVVEACRTLHGGIENIPAYLTKVLDGRDSTAEMARRVQALLKKGVA